MEIPYRLAQAIWVRRSTTYAGDPRHGNDAVVARADEVPGYAVVVDPNPDGDKPVILTVLFACRDTYTRNGSTYEVTP